MTVLKQKRTGQVHREQDENGSYFFDFNHDFQVWKARKDAGLSVRQQEILTDHFLNGKYLRDKETGDKYLIERVYKEWHGGWYIKLLTQKDGSHGVREWESINCFYPLILRRIKENHKDYEVVE